METLATWIAREGRLPEEHAVGWIVRMAKALEPVHLIGKAHGRLSAAALLMDGVSCHEPGAIAPVDTLRDEVAYHSPERAIGAAPSPANDTWAAVVMLYIALTGSVPFAARSDESLRMCFAGPPPRRLESFGVDNAKLQRIIDRAFMLARESRLESMVELRKELSAIYPASDWLGALAQGQDSEPPAAPASEPPPTSADAPSWEAGADDEEEPETAIVDASALGLDSIPRPQRPPAAAPSPQAAPPAIAEPASPEPPAAQEPARAAPAEPPPSAAPTRHEPPAEEQPPKSAPPPKPRAEPPPPPSRRKKPAAPPPQQAAVDDGPASDDLPPTPVAGQPVAPAARVPETRPREPREAASAASKVAEREAESFDAPLDPRAAFRDLVDTDRKGRPKRDAAPRSSGAAGPARAEAPAGAPALKRRPPPAVAAADSAPPQRQRKKRRRRSKLHGIVQAILILLIGAGVFFAFRPDMLHKVEDWFERQVMTRIRGPVSTQPTPAVPTAAAPSNQASTTAVATSATEPAPATSGSGAAAARADGTADTAAEAGAPKAPESPAELKACAASFFLPDAFADVETDFTFLCTERIPRKGAAALKSQVVLRGQRGDVTEAMREWAMIGWFEIAAFVAIRSRCCANPEPLYTPETLAQCQLDPALDRLAITVKGDDDQQLAAAIDDYFTAMQCLFRVGAGSVFGMLGPSTAGSRAAIDKLLARGRSAPR